MALASEAPTGGFRLSQLVYDTRYRAFTIQIVALLLFLAALWWLYGNLTANLELKGRPLSFGFLLNNAGYDIPQQLIPFSSSDTHLRAAVVGLLNTLLLAVCGCILATLIGVIVGVLRLSRNWLVARLMTVYVEIFRNVPLLLWILIVFVPLSEIAPAPAAFKVTDEMVASGTPPAASMDLFGTVAITNRGVYVPAPVLENAPASGWLTFLIVAGVLAASIAVHVTLRRRARAVQEATGIRPATWWKSLLVLVVPIAVVLALMGFRLDMPQPPTRFNFEGGTLIFLPFVALLIALSLYTGAFIAEAVRAGIMAISKGQTEAAGALGLRPNWTMRLVVLPQALRVIIPPMISQYLNLTKNTSLAIAVSYLDLRGTLGGITLNQTGREVECMLLMMLIYLTISLTISSVMNFYNASVQLKER